MTPENPDRLSGPDPRAGREVIDWSEITEPGCYLHLASGLLARIDPETIARRRPAEDPAHVNRVVKLADDPATPLVVLRLAAQRRGYPARF